MPPSNQGACQSRKTAKIRSIARLMANIPNQQLAANPNIPSPSLLGGGSRRAKRNGGETRGNIRRPRRVDAAIVVTRSRMMFGKLAGAWLGEKVAGNMKARKARSSAMARWRWRSAACQPSRRWRSAAGHSGNGASVGARILLTLRRRPRPLPPPEAGFRNRAQPCR
jgi:hypothetical protein